MRQGYYALILYAEDYDGYGPELGYRRDERIPQNVPDDWWSEVRNIDEQTFVCPATHQDALDSSDHPGQYRRDDFYSNYNSTFGYSTRGDGPVPGGTGFYGWPWRNDPTVVTPNVNYLGRRITPPSGATARFVPEPTDQPMMHDAGHAPDGDEPLTYEMFISGPFEPSHLTLFQTNFVYMDGHTVSYRFDDVTEYWQRTARHDNVHVDSVHARD